MGGRDGRNADVHDGQLGDLPRHRGAKTSLSGYQSLRCEHLERLSDRVPTGAEPLGDQRLVEWLIGCDHPAANAGAE
jgi:hypothetical protein